MRSADKTTRLKQALVISGSLQKTSLLWDRDNGNPNHPFVLNKRFLVHLFGLNGECIFRRYFLKITTVDGETLLFFISSSSASIQSQHNTLYTHSESEILHRNMKCSQVECLPQVDVVQTSRCLDNTILK